MRKIYCQHGDVALEVVESIPQDAKKVKVSEGFVVEKGEGIHVHVLKSSARVAVKEGMSPCAMNKLMDKVEVYEVNDQMYIKVKESVVLDHEEHGIQTLEPGIYKKNIEREYSYADNEERRVLD